MKAIRFVLGFSVIFFFLAPILLLIGTLNVLTLICCGFGEKSVDKLNECWNTAMSKIADFMDKK
jgi:hypothetical protein